MSLKMLAEVADLSDWIGEPITGEQDEKRAAMCLRIASALVRSETGRTWSGSDEPVPEVAFMVALYCASRVYENREAETQAGLDDWQSSHKVLEAGAYLTASERRMLGSLNRSQFGGLGTVATTRGEVPEATGWVPTGTPDVYFPWY